MKQTTALILLAIVAAAGPPPLQAQSSETYTFTTNRALPDGNPAGLSDVRTVNSAIGVISSVQVHLKINGEFNGDLYGYLRHSSGMVVLLNRPGKTATNSAGYDDSGLDVEFQNGAANGDLHLYRNVTIPSGGLPLTGTWQPDGRNVDPGAVTDASPRTTSLTNFVGLSAAGEWTMYLADMDSGGTNMLVQWTLEVSGAAAPTLSWTNPADIVYGAPLGSAQLNATATYNSTPVAGAFVYSQASGTILAAGAGQTISVTFTPSDGSSFLTVTTNVVINVSKASLLITANNTNEIYGAGLPVFTASYSGFTNGDTANSLTTPVALATSASSASPVGNYTITASAATSANYNISFSPGVLTVTPASLNITANDTNKMYGATLPGFTASYSGFVNNDTAANLTTPVTFGTGASSGSPVGTYGITVSGATDTNYNITFHSGALSVTRAAIIVTANDKTKTYGQSLPPLTATYSGFTAGDGTNNLTTVAALTTTATATSAVGNYSITASGASSPNYTFSYVPGTLAIGQSLTTGALASSANPALPSASVTFTMTLAAVPPGGGSPTGTVSFRIDGAVAGSGILSGGVATFSINTLAHGSHAVAAEYAGDQNFVGFSNTLAVSETINTPPVAGNIAIVRYPTQGVKVRLATILAAASDADSDTLNITVNSTSVNGGTVSVIGKWVYYTPADGDTSADSFTYTVTDGNGGSATGSVAVNIEVDNNVGQNLVLTDLGNGSYLIDGSGIPARVYRLQFTDSLTPANWQDLSGGSVTADAAGKFQYTDTSGSPTRYYRSVNP